MRHYHEYEENIIFEKGFEIELEQVRYTIVVKVNEYEFSLYTATKRLDNSIFVNKIYITKDMLGAMVNSQK